MKTQDVIEFFGNKVKAAAALDLTPEAIRLWREYPPYERQCQIQIETKGKLKAEKPKQ